MGSLRLLTLALCFGLCPILSSAVEFYDIRNCLLRFQTPRNGATTVGSRMTQRVWNHDSDDVARTIESFSNAEGHNLPLWLSGSTALLYAGFITSDCISMVPQSGLNQDNTAVSIILPPGVGKLERVGPNLELITGDNARRTLGIQGLSGQIDADDYAYTTGGALKEALEGWQASRGARSEPLSEFYFGATEGGSSSGETVLIRVPVI